jgi:DNA helicase-2/ATP-dependent DNA helicase PcrA
VVDRRGRRPDASPLTADQRRVVDSPAGALCLLAGAGSGKTRVLVERTTRRILDGSAAADHTLVVTFTRNAAAELRSRLAASGVPTAFPPGRHPAPTVGVRVGTLHQVALSMLRRHAADRLARAPVIVSRRARLVADSAADPEVALLASSEISWAKARCLGPDRYVDAAVDAGRLPEEQVTAVGAAYRRYEQGLARRGVVDLDDVLLRAGELLETDRHFADAMAWRYRHLAVDEFQDVNPAQFRIVLALARRGGDLLAVGDPNQAIYGWNGSDPRLLHALPDHVDGMVVLRMMENHRSSPEIVAAGSAVLGPGRVGTLRSSRPPGARPRLWSFPDEATEAEHIATVLSQWSLDGRRWSDMAVLARTNHRLATIRTHLERRGLPCRSAPPPEADERTAVTPDPPGATRTAPYAETDPDGVHLVTFHRAKGLEWPAVWVAGLEDGTVPVRQATTLAQRDEECRLLYVAVTRAADELCCSWSRSVDPGGDRPLPRRPSPWIERLAPHCEATTHVPASPGTAPSGDSSATGRPGDPPGAGDPGSVPDRWLARFRATLAPGASSGAARAVTRAAPPRSRPPRERGPTA